MEYRPRVMDRELDARLKALGAVVIEGPRAVGKTATARQHAASSVLLDVDDNARRAAQLDPSLVLDGETPRLLDEWQVVPGLWNRVRRAVDERGRPGQFIMTGSAVPADDETRHIGAGRFSRLAMRPMALRESGHSTGEVRLEELVAGQPVRAADPGLTLQDLIDRVCVGGWPLLLDVDVASALQANRDYLGEVSRADLRRVDGVRRDPARVAATLAALARHVSTIVATRTLALDLGDGGRPADAQVVASYLSTLERLHIIEDQPAWAPSLRSRSRVRSSPKRHLVDPSLAVAAIGGSPARLLADLNYFGFLFESLVVRDLRVYAQPLGGRILHYRDNTGLEVDAVLELPDGSWGAVEIKLGTDQVDRACTRLSTFAERVDTARTGPPAFLAVITGTGYGYRRTDGIDVIPIGALRD